MTGLIDPELCFALFAGAELLDDLHDDKHARARMAVLHLSPDYILAAREDAVFGVAVETDDLVFIDIGDVDRQVPIDEIDLIEREVSGADIKRLLRRSCLVPVFCKQGSQVGSQITIGCLRFRRCLDGLGLLRGLPPGIADFPVARLHLLEFRGRNER